VVSGNECDINERDVKLELQQKRMTLETQQASVGNLSITKRM
jgi:hypothetical protein